MYGLSYCHADHETLLPILREVMLAEQADQTGPAMMAIWKDVVEQTDTWDGSWLVVSIDEGSRTVVLRPWSGVDKPTDDSQDITVGVNAIFSVQCY
jgi:hypothetical protein